MKPRSTRLLALWQLRAEAERGSVTLFMLAAATALLLAVGLAVDGGAKIAAVQQATRSAAEAARVGAQQVDITALQAGAGADLDPGLAQAAARAALAAAGVEGTALATSTSVEVTARISKPTVFLALIGIGEVVGSGSASVDLVMPGQ